jgi:hypothetical protein
MKDMSGDKKGAFMRNPAIWKILAFFGIVTVVWESVCNEGNDGRVMKAGFWRAGRTCGDTVACTVLGEGDASPAMPWIDMVGALSLKFGVGDKGERGKGDRPGGGKGDDVGEEFVGEELYGTWERLAKGSSSCR